MILLDKFNFYELAHLYEKLYESRLKSWMKKIKSKPEEAYKDPDSGNFKMILFSIIRFQKV